MKNLRLEAGGPTLTLEAADEMTNAAPREAKTRASNAISVVVVDASGRVLVSKTMVHSRLNSC